MEHPHQQQLKVLAIAVGALTALLRDKGVLAHSEVTQIFSIADQLTPESDEAGYEMIALLGQIVASIESKAADDDLLSAV